MHENTLHSAPRFWPVIADHYGYCRERGKVILGGGGGGGRAEGGREEGGRKGEKEGGRREGRGREGKEGGMILTFHF